MTLSDGIKKHESLIIVAVLLIASVAGYSHVINWLDNRAQVADQKAQAALQVQIQQNNVLAQQAAQSQATYAALVMKIEADTQQVISAQNKITQQTKDQISKDASLPADQLASRWSILVQKPVSEIVPQAQSMSVSPGVALATVQQLETIPQLQSDVQSEKQIVTIKDSQIDGLVDLNTKLTGQVSGLNGEITAQTTACKTEVAKVKADARKSKFKIAGIMIGIGAILAHVAGI